MTRICLVCHKSFETKKITRNDLSLNFCSDTCRKKANRYKLDKEQETLKKIRSEILSLMYREQAKDLKRFTRKFF